MPGAFMLNPFTGQYDPNRNMGIGAPGGIPQGTVQQPGGPNAWNGIQQTDGGHLSADGQTWVPGNRAPAPMGGAPGFGGVPGGGTSSLATGGAVAGGSAGTYSGEKQLAQIRDDFRRMTESGISGINEDLNGRGIFSSGVGAKISGDYRTQMGQQEGSAIERLQNDILGRNQSYELAKSQAEWQKQLALMGGGSQRYTSANTGGNENQDLMQMFQQMMGQQGGGVQQGTMNTQPQQGGGQVPQQYAGSMPSGNRGDTKGVEPTHAPGETMTAYYQRLNAWHAQMRAWNEAQGIRA